LSRSITELSLIRAMAGVALGMASPIVLAMVSNLASDQWRGLAVGATLAGNPIGSAVGSAIAMRIAGIDYAPGFAFTGCVVLAALVPIALSEPSPVPSTAQRRKPVQTLLTPLYRDITVRLGLCFFLSLALTSTLSSWQPTYFESLADIPVQKFATVAIYGAPASVLGMLSAGFFSIRAPRPIVVTVIFGGHALALASTGWLSFGTAGFAAAYFASSVMQSAGQGLLNVIIAERYPDTIRATAFAAAAAAGRAGGIIGPWFGVAPIAAHVQLALVFSFLSCVPLIVGMLILSHKQTARTEPSG
jgi:AAHS family 4-hydroxybenzoate transporter-like MFS transporter